MTDFFQDLNGALVANRPAFQGATYEPKHDQARLTGQLKRVRDCMADGRFRTLAEIAVATGDPEAKELY